MEIQPFDPQQDYSVMWRRLPHWSQAGTITFITWRTWDSLPRAVVESWQGARDAWLIQHGINPNSDWRGQVEQLGPPFVRELQLLLSDRWNDHLDECHGACVLRRPELAAEVANSLLHFDGDRYQLTDFVVMPNHVHILVAFPNDECMLRQCESWKHFMATQINRRLERRGRFWQQDGFDHLVRSTEQFDWLREYCADNPRRAHLSPGEFIHYSKILPESC